jgi:hydroxyacylglutathione hydrolase
MIMPQQSPIVEPVQVLGDNYVWMFASGKNQYVAVDPGEAGGVIRWLQQRGATLSHILLTHHHADHIGGVEPLRAEYRAEIIGSQADSHRLPRLDRAVTEGDSVLLGEQSATVLATPGHTMGHVVYLVGDALFSGDTLFSLGCGRLFEGTAAMMWQSLNKIQALPDATRIFCAHEYTLTNHGFALSLEPDNRELLAMQQGLLEKNNNDRPTLPTTLAAEKKLNPFLRTQESSLARSLGLEAKNPVERFAHIRELRNRY